MATTKVNTCKGKATPAIPTSTPVKERRFSSKENSEEGSSDSREDTCKGEKKSALELLLPGEGGEGVVVFG